MTDDKGTVVLLAVVVAFVFGPCRAAASRDQTMASPIMLPAPARTAARVAKRGSEKAAAQRSGWRGQW